MTRSQDPNLMMTNARSTSSRLFHFLGSMNLAITLLVLLAIASVIGTILQQNKPYTDYEVKFGSFWFEIYRMLGLYDVYSAIWFLVILAFLILSITVCVIRYTPGILRELRHYRESAKEKSLLAMKHHAVLTTNLPNPDIQAIAQQALKSEKFRFRIANNDSHTTLAAMSGAGNRWGYWFTHLGMIVLLLGGLLDSRLPLMLAEWQGKLKPETRNIPASEVPQISRLGPQSFAYRGSVDVPEGKRANVIFLNVRDGYLVQRLPFEVEVKDFRVEHYSTGQPKSFESDIVIYDPDHKEPISTTISVNHPMIYKGTAIYQASFGDGGSEIDMRLRPFNVQYANQDVKGNIFQNYTLKASNANYQVELKDFRIFNINPVTDEKGKVHQKNMGPSLIFRLRNAAGEAIEYTNYMAPVEIEGRPYFISGVRTSPADPQRFLHIPADSNSSVDLFFNYLRKLQDNAAVRKAVTNMTQDSMKDSELSNPAMQEQVIDSMIRLTEMFASSGFEGIQQDLAQRFPKEKVEEASKAFMKVLQAALRAVYMDTLAEQGKTELTDKDWLFFDDSLAAIANLPFYGSPWYVQMTNFKHIQASGLQMTRSPGQNIVYLGSIMLTIGVFLLFYIARRRLWILIKPRDDGQSDVILAGTTNRNQKDFDHYFQGLQSAFQRALTARGA